MSGPVFGIIVGLLALAGAVCTVGVMSTVYREASCFTRLLVIGISIGLLWKAGVAFTTPRAIDLGDFLIVTGIGAVYVRRLWHDGDGSVLDLLRRRGPL